jgi:hypothetical protein
VSLVGPPLVGEHEFLDIPAMPPCGPGFVGKSLKSDDLSQILGLKPTNRPSFGQS